MEYIEITFLIVASYLIGSISTAILVCQLFKLPDPRTQGSLNPGATNVLRMGGKLPALLTLLGDALKGVIPVAFASWLGFSPLVLSLVALAAFIGHLYPIFFKFLGGKGVATALGILLVLSVPVFFCWVVTWLVIAFVFRFVSMASMLAMIFTPLYMWLFQAPTVYILLTSLMAFILIYRHRSNIEKIIKGKEEKI